MAVSSAVKIDTGGKEKDFLRLWNSVMAKAAPAEPFSSTEPSVKMCRNYEYLYSSNSLVMQAKPRLALVPRQSRRLHLQLRPFHQPWGVGMKGSICRRGIVQSCSLDQVGDQVADGGAVGDTGGASEGPTHLFDSLAAEHIIWIWSLSGSSPASRYTRL